MYMRRKIDRFLQEWKDLPDHKPLIIKGARQIGKTASIREFGRQHYKCFIEINFIFEPQYKQITTDGYTAQQVIKNLTLINPSLQLIPGETLLFFDELQAHPDMATTLKSFQEDGRFDVICSGSLLGIHYKQIESVSVGYKQNYEMRSLDFEEFLWTQGYGDDAVSELLEHMLTLKPFSALVLNRFNTLFLDYCVLGGMPGVIRQFVETQTFSGTLAIQRQLLLDYEEDVRKYAKGMDQTRIINVLRHITPQLAKENKKFQISKVASGARFRDYRGCIEWLLDSGIVQACYCLLHPELPLGGNYDENKFKLYYADSGLLVATLDDEVQQEFRATRDLGVYKGALYENIIAEALTKAGLPLYYYRRDNSTLEEDFFVRTVHELVPIEVKSTNNTSKSLRLLIASSSYPDILYGLKIAGSNLGYSDHIYTFPHFCAFLLGKFLHKFVPRERKATSAPGTT
ncbi:MAG: ATP-binding protein [Clostridia bacterium]|nr:ATP-binding protein [Clostridia bacterium]